MTRSHTKRYPPELRERAVRLVFESIEDEDRRSGRRSPAIARKLGIGAETLRIWVRRAEIDRGAAAGDHDRERERVRELERENRELRRANEILKAASVFFARELDPRLPKMSASSPSTPGALRGRADLPGAAGRPVHLLRAASSAALGRARGATRAAGARSPGSRAEHRRVYGADKVWAQLNARGHPGRPLHRRAPDARSSASQGVRPGQAGPRPRSPASRAPSRPAIWSSAQLRRRRPEPAVGRRPHLRDAPTRLGLRRLRRRRLLPLRIVGWQARRVTCAPTWRSTPWRWRSGRAGAGPGRADPSQRPRRAVPRRSATPSALPRPAPSPRSARAATATTMPWPSRSTACTRPS